MIHPETRLEFVSEVIGSGVVATVPLPKGTLVWVQDPLDLVLTPRRLQRLHPALRLILDRYGYDDPEGNTILCWDGGRMMNHSCDPTTRGLGPHALVTRRPLRAGDPITCDYAECNLSEDLHCACGAKNCRGRVTGTDLLTLGWHWDEEAEELAKRAAKVDQPLLEFALYREDLEDYIAGRSTPPPFASQCSSRVSHGYH